MPDDDDILGSMTTPDAIPIMEDLGSESGSEGAPMAPPIQRRTKRGARAGRGMMSGMGPDAMRAVAGNNPRDTATPITVR